MKDTFPLTHFRSISTSLFLRLILMLLVCHRMQEKSKGRSTERGRETKWASEWVKVKTKVAIKFTWMYLAICVKLKRASKLDRKSDDQWKKWLTKCSSNREREREREREEDAEWTSALIRGNHTNAMVSAISEPGNSLVTKTTGTLRLYDLLFAV